MSSFLVDDDYGTEIAGMLPAFDLRAFVSLVARKRQVM